MEKVRSNQFAISINSCTEWSKTKVFLVGVPLIAQENLEPKAFLS